MESYCIVVCEDGRLAGFWDEENGEQVQTEQEANWYETREDAEKVLGEIPRKIDARIWKLQPEIATMTRAAPTISSGM